MYHRHHSWQHHLYPAEPWPEYPDPRPPQPPPSLQPPPPPPQPPYTHDLLAPRLALAGSLDPATGIFYRSPEHPRLRTAQACEKCRTRKAKCSGEHPTCKRCSTRGLVCEYAKEGRVRGPNKPKPKPQPPSPADTTKDSPSSSSKTQHELDHTDLVLAPAAAPPPHHQHRRHSDRAVRPRPSNLRLDRTHTRTPHAPPQHFSTTSLYAAPDSSESSAGGGGRRSCSLSESGGSVPSSAVSSTFDLSPSPIHPHAFQPTNGDAAACYPPSTHIHQLTHDHQQRLLTSTVCDLSSPSPPAHPHPQTQYTHTHGIKQEHAHEEGGFSTRENQYVLHPQQQQYIPLAEMEYASWGAAPQLHYAYDGAGAHAGGGRHPMAMGGYQGDGAFRS